MELAAKAPGWLEKILLPQLSEMRGEIRAMDGKLAGRIDALEAKMDVEFRTIHSEIRRLDERVGGFDKRMDLTQRLGAVEARVRELEARR